MPLDSNGSSESQVSNSGLDAANSGGDTGIDFKGLFEDQRSQLEETKTHSTRLAQELESVKGNASKSSAELERIKRAITGGEEEEIDPVMTEVQSLESQMDQYLQAALEHERAGKPIPLTINSAVQGLKHQIRYAKEAAAASKEMADLKAKIARMENPQNNIEMTAYSNIDNQIESAVQSIYGKGDDYSGVRAAQFEAISKLVVGEIKDLKVNDPKLWERIARDRKAQVNLVNHFVKQAIPPQARAIMDREVLMNTPMTTEELMSAFSEAREKSLKDPKAAQHMSEIRQEVLSRIMEKNMGGGGSKARINDLF